MFFCPGCQSMHGVWVRQPNPTTGAQWTWNGSAERPTFAPSIVIYGEPSEGRKTRVMRCHSFIRDGRIQYLDDSEHGLRGQTVALPTNPLHQ
jgi:hypothetical protein